MAVTAVTDTHLVVGMGEVGTAVAEVLSRAAEVATRDVDPVDVSPVRVMHVCIPWSDQFPRVVAGYQSDHQADLVIVHSTVPVGTCDPRGWVHSPVRGRHPHLVDALVTFTKHFGGRRAGEAAKWWASCGDLPVAVHPRAAEPEAGKLWELVQFGHQVLVEQAIHQWCVDHGLDPDVVYRQFASTYNDGYQALGEYRFVRPILRHMPGPIGGHCVRQNAALLDHPLARTVARS